MHHPQQATGYQRQPPKGDELVYSVEDKCDDKNLAHRFPAIPQHVSPVLRLGEKATEIGGLAFFGIF
jgi:hypothetical protein